VLRALRVLPILVMPTPALSVLVCLSMRSAPVLCMLPALPSCSPGLVSAVPLACPKGAGSCRDHEEEAELKVRSRGAPCCRRRCSRRRWRSLRRRVCTEGHSMARQEGFGGWGGGHAQHWWPSGWSCGMQTGSIPVASPRLLCPWSSLYPAHPTCDPALPTYPTMPIHPPCPPTSFCSLSSTRLARLWMEMPAARVKACRVRPCKVRKAAGG